MTDDTKKVFISYRRALSIDLAGRVHDHLVSRGYDVFFDISSIPSGEFGRLILRQIEARPLFVPVLVPGCFDRAVNADDWFRREIEHALAKKRHILPLGAKGFSFDKAGGGKDKTLPGRLGELTKYHYIDVPDTYFAEAMNKLIAGLAAIPGGVDIWPTPVLERPTVQRMIDVAKVARPDAAGSGWVVPARNASVLSLPLDAPTLKEGGVFLGRRLSWTPILGASGYTLQRSLDQQLFSPFKEIYDGDQTSFIDLDPDADVSEYLPRGILRPSRHYRVKAKGDGILFSDSPWSNLVTLDVIRRLFTQLAAPHLELHPLGMLSFGLRFAWRAVEGATGYVLENGADNSFIKPVTIYEGSDLEFTHLTIGGARTSAVSNRNFYRLKAIGGPLALDSPWSNVVEGGSSRSLFR